MMQAFCGIEVNKNLHTYLGRIEETYTKPGPENVDKGDLFLHRELEIKQCSNREEDDDEVREEVDHASDGEGENLIATTSASFLVLVRLDGLADEAAYD